MAVWRLGPTCSVARKPWLPGCPALITSGSEARLIQLHAAIGEGQKVFVQLLLWFAAVLFLVLAPAWAQGKRVALVIGNSEYAHATRLENPKNDAADVAAALQALGFQVIQGVDLDKAAMDRTIRDFTAALSGDSRSITSTRRISSHAAGGGALASRRPC